MWALALLMELVCLLSMRKIVCWRHFLCFVDRSIRHVDLSHLGKTGFDSVTSGYSKICGYDRPRVSEFTAYSRISTLETVFENVRIGYRIRGICVNASCIRKKNCGYKNGRGLLSTHSKTIFLLSRWDWAFNVSWNIASVSFFWLSAVLKERAFGDDSGIGRY